MSEPLISRSCDLRRLWTEGYDIAIDGAWLLVRQVPYVDRQRSVQCGTLALKLSLQQTPAGEATTKPADHTAYFDGAEPCDAQGRALTEIINSSDAKQTIDGRSFRYRFSHKPLENGSKRFYVDYFEQVSTYAEILADQARAVSAAASAFPAVRQPPVESDYPFQYSDTASVRAGISDINRRVSGQVVGIIGLGGTGSYILDMVAKTHVRELRLWDRDAFEQHTAFRAPGAASADELEQLPTKCEYYQAIYSKMRTGVIAHPYHMEADHFGELDGLDFAFVAVDRGPSRGKIVPALLERDIPFIDVGMGMAAEEHGLTGQARVTLVTHETREFALAEIPTDDVDADADDVYGDNVQIAEMNALNAVLAVIKWKKHMGVYADVVQEWDSAYMIASNAIVNTGAAS